MPQSILALAVLVLASVLPAQSSAPLTVVGPDGAVHTLTATQLHALPAVSGTATAHDTRFTFTGVDLRDVLRLAGVSPVDSLRRGQLRRVVVFVGADGYSALIALSDLDPSIGGRRAVLVDREDGTALPPERGPRRIIVEGDRRPSRWVRQVVRIEVRDLPEGASGPTSSRPAVAPPPNGWVVVADSASSEVRTLALAAADDLGGYLHLLRPLPRRLTVRLEHCGASAQAVWLVESAEILLCDEMLRYATASSDAPRSIARFILAHELGHAVADELDEPAVGSGETEADQFAAVFLIATERFATDLREAAALMRRLADLPDLLGATRVERLERAAALACLGGDWADSATTACSESYARARDRWARRVLHPVP